MAEEFPIRPVTSDEFASFRHVHEHAFNAGPPSAARWARGRRQFEPERSLAAFDASLPAGEQLVGTTGVYSLRMAVPPRRTRPPISRPDLGPRPLVPMHLLGNPP